MNEYSISPEERETLIKVIDLLSMDVLRLKSENESLKMTIQTLNKGAFYRGSNTDIEKPEKIWTRIINYYRREGFINTIKKIISKISGH